jgi:hypothetical protein
MQYKAFPTNVLSSPKDGLVIQLWEEDGIWRPKLLIGVLSPIPFFLIWGNNELKASEKERFTSSEISKNYIKI